MKKILEIDLENINELDYISIVDDPAIGVNFIKLSNVQQQVCLQDEKMMITGPVLIPDLLIDRWDESTNKPYYLKLTRESIEKISMKTMLSLNSKKSLFNLEHKKGTEIDWNKVYLYESWIKTQDEDKSNSNFDLPKGTWFISLKTDDPIVWQNLKKYNGFSIQGQYQLREVEMSGDFNSKIMEFKSFIDKKN